MDINNKLYKNQGIHVITALFTVEDGKFKVLLIKRKNEPYKNKWILVGGACYNNEDVEHAMKREMYEKTGLKNINFSFFKVYSNPTRSPLMRMIAITYLGVIDCKKVKIIKETAKTSDADWFQIDRIPELGYDHKEILLDAINNLKQKMFESQILKGLFSETFTIPQLYNAYSSILDKKIDRRNFRKKLLNDGIIRDTGQVQINEGKKSAKLYAFV